MKVLITGAARGLGLSLTTEAVKRGATVFAGVRHPEQVSEAFQQLKSLFPGKIHVLPLDVTSEASCVEAAITVKETVLSLDVVINNAGVLTERDKSIVDLDMEELERTFDVNLYGPMRVVKAFLPILHRGPEAAIINISSEAGSFANAYGGDYPYAISKHALNMFSEQLRKSLQGEKTMVYAIHPGWIKTDMGGDQAPGTPEETARGIWDIVEKKTEVKSKASFINFKGEEMPL